MRYFPIPCWSICFNFSAPLQSGNVAHFVGSSFISNSQPPVFATEGGSVLQLETTHCVAPE